MKDYIVFGYTNCRYKNLAVFWASYIKKLNVDYIIYCTDQESYKFLRSADVKCALSSFQKNSENFEFTDFGLVRFNILFDLLKSYKNVIYSDLDAIWISNPIPELLIKGIDANLSTVHHPKAHPTCIREKWGSVICTGWMHFSDVCAPLIGDFIEKYDQYGGNDQGKFNGFLASLCDNFTTNVPGHSFTIDINAYSLKLLGLHEKIVFRDEKVYVAPSFTKVLHPVLGIGNYEGSKIKLLKKILARI